MSVRSPDTSPGPPPDAIQRLVFGALPSFAMLAGMQLDLFSALAGEPRRAEGLAADLGLDPERLEALLYALVVAGLLEHREGRFGNAPEAARFLVRGSPHYLGPLEESLGMMWQAALRTADSIREGSPAAKIDFATMSPEELATFLGGLHGEALEAGRSLAASGEFSARRSVADVGGGSGGLSIGLAERCPDLRATVIDLPAVVPVAERFVADAGAGGRVGIVAADVAASPPPGTYDVAVLRAVVQVLPPSDAGRVIRNVAAALEPGGEMIIIGRILDDSRLTPESTVLSNLVFLNLFEGGRAYTRGEHRRWLADAGMVDVRFEGDPGGRAQVRARKP
ncbi:MAG TPA: class I SAM-dependent methyltransferase [Gemmatimonadota bacterium]|nr:class I SAM-dependent methyltransferase [Gemmatimonadota bacterium]